jgi:lipoate-protein ligase A
MAVPCRILPHSTADGASNMALDEALLDSVAADPSAAVVRTYEWTEPTLSLGYFQSFADSEADLRWAGVPIVRRPTGGGALWHDREVTYAVVVPADHPASRPSRALYATIHQAIADHLQSLGIEAGRRGMPENPTPVPSPFLCFADRDADDVIVDGVKIVGSAQRRRSGAVLQHGSLLLSRSRTTPELPGLADLVGSTDDGATWGATLAGLLADALDLETVRDVIRPDEAAGAAWLVQNRYADSSWTRRR